ncbi:hypothetical protein AVEN_121282-1 [Araneus ventricosus]|uniref:Uncharacterized protein n=1 Tax=Araneus ventricosus TaxID=182803 RepID=A0A4Y2SPB9_ARAVE|nr:hypothetical protein AVEN_121282-1 [Araneus ventricosus]
MEQNFVSVRNGLNRICSFAEVISAYAANIPDRSKSRRLSPLNFLVDLLKHVENKWGKTHKRSLTPDGEKNKANVIPRVSLAQQENGGSKIKETIPRNYVIWLFFILSKQSNMQF